MGDTEGPGFATPLPYDSGAESALIGAMLLRTDVAIDMVDRLRAEHFYVPVHRNVFSAIAVIVGRGEKAIDVITVLNELKSLGVAESVGGVGKLVELQTACPSVGNSASYAAVILDKAQRRELIGVAKEIASAALSVSESSEAVSEAERLLSDAADISGRTVTASHVVDLFDEHLDRLEILRERKGAMIGVPTGYTELDNTLLGLQGGQMVVLGARPAMGKTAMALGVAAHVAQETQRPVLFFSLEMSRMEVVDRLVSGYGRIPLRNVRSGDMDTAEWEKYIAIHGGITEVPLFVVDEPAIDLSRVRMEIRKLVQEEGDLALVVIDYLQLMTPSGRTKSREQEVSELSRGIKLMAKEFGVPVMALSQLSRNLEQRADKRPILADLRESGCMPASTRLLRADNGGTVTLGELVVSQERVAVWSVNEDGALVAKLVVNAFPSGKKLVYRMRLSSGLSVDATGNHKFLTREGWMPLDELSVGDRVAVPAALPEPLEPEALDAGTDFGALALEMVSKGTIRDWVHALPSAQIVEVVGALVRHLPTKFAPATPALSTLYPLEVEVPSREFGESLGRVMLRLGVRSMMRPDFEGKDARTGNGLSNSNGLSNRLCVHHDDLSLLYKKPTKKVEGRRVAWERVVSIHSIGEQPVFDATVEDTHNFIAEGIVAHNSIEQDSDIVLFVYRDEIYHPESPDVGTAEIIVAKHRQGATGTSKVGFIPSYALFANMGVSGVVGSSIRIGDPLPTLAGEKAAADAVDYSSPSSVRSGDEF